MFAISARSGGNVWVPAFKAGAKVERAELVIVGSDHFRYYDPWQQGRHACSR